jgi:hypothetical protein
MRGGSGRSTAQNRGYNECQGESPEESSELPGYRMQHRQILKFPTRICGKGDVCWGRRQADWRSFVPQREANNTPQGLNALAGNRCLYFSFDCIGSLPAEFLRGKWRDLL